MKESLLADVKVDLRVINYSQVDHRWGETNSKPQFNRIYYICAGEGFVTIDHVTYYPQPGDFVLIPANHTISFGGISENYYLKYWCHFDALVGHTNLFDYVQIPYVVAAKEHPLVIQHLNELIACSNYDDLASKLETKSLLLKLLAWYIREGEKRSNDVKTIQFNEKISHILHYIERHMGTPLTVNELALELNFHPNYFIRFFKHALGISPKRYILKQRMKQAEHLLLSSAYSISEIGEKVGYSSVYHFSKIFKQYVGHSPTDYRAHFLK